MRMRSFPFRRLAVFVCTAALTGTASAAVFKCKAADGSIVFQDSGCGPQTQPLQPTKTDEGTAVNRSLPLDERVKNPYDKRRLDAAIHITGLQQGLRKRIEHCQKHAPEQAPLLQSLLDGWRSERAAAIAASERLIERYLTTAERADALNQFDNTLSGTIELSINSDPAVNANNCKSAAIKMRQYLDKRYVTAYALVEGGR